MIKAEQGDTLGSHWALCRTVLSEVMTFKLRSEGHEGESHTKLYGNCSQCGLWNPWGSQRPFQEVNEVNTIFIIILRCYLFFAQVDIRRDGANVMAAKMAGTSA